MTKKTRLIFEAGPTHNGLESAKDLANIVKKVGGDAIKFQMLNTEKLVADLSVPFSYKILVDKENEVYEDKTEPLYDILKRRAMEQEEWLDLKKHCDDLGLEFYCTLAFNEEVDFAVNEMKVHSIKIASSDVDNLPFIEYAAKSGVNIQLDTGSGNIWEIERAVNVIEATGNKDIVIHHCPSGYPARIESIHLNMIPTLRKMFPEHVIAYSDHTPGWDMDIAAVTLGAELIEKTITHDRCTPSVEHLFSLEPDDAEKFVNAMRELESALGSSRRIIPADALESRKATRRSIYAARDLNAGESIGEADLYYRRPGYGITPDKTDTVTSMQVKNAIAKDTMIKWEDLG